MGIKPSDVKILLACEKSGAMYNAFRNLGFSVLSCDLEPSLHNGNHYTGSFFDLDIQSFDFVMLFYPCTYFAKAQLYRCVAGSLYHELQLKAGADVKRFLSSGVSRYAIENPVGALPRFIGNYSQKVHPYYFGDPYSKEICLWLKGVPPLISSYINSVRKPIENHTNGRMSQVMKSDIKSSWRWFPGMCEAIATQWGYSLMKDLSISVSSPSHKSFTV